MNKLFFILTFLLFISFSCGDKDQTNSKESSATNTPSIVNPTTGDDEAQNPENTPSSNDQNTFPEFFKNDKGNLHVYFGIGASRRFAPRFYFCVPEDGNSLFNSVALAYLIKVRKDDDKLKKRFEMLFSNPDSGDEKDIIETREYETILDLIKNLEIYHFSMISINDPKWEELLNRFRKKVSFYIEKNNEDFKKYYNSDNNLDKQRNYKELSATDFEDYKTKTKINSAYAGWTHISAISDMLDQQSITIVELGKNTDIFTYHSFKYSNQDDFLQSISLVNYTHNLQFGVEL